ncbi:hypothetical protein NCC49_000616 [Naganishia albida]|nr:hypothetical protein NCC49_000616 [Naganishia albida]
MPRRFSLGAVFRDFAYRLRHHPSFYVSVFAHLICATATVGFILAFIQQASYTGNTRRLNIVIIAALLGAVLFTSCFLILARIIAVRTSFNTIPKPYIPTKHIDVPRKVAEHITREYTRTGVIAYISQPTAGKQEGWGRPGTQFASIHFRKSIRETFHAILKTLDDQSPPTQHTVYPPYAIRQISLHPNWPHQAQPLLDMYDAILTKAKYARSEPDAQEYERCIKIVALIMGLIKTAHQARHDLPETPVNQGIPRQDPGTARFVSSPSSFTHDTTHRPSEGEAIQPLPEAHLASPYSTLRNRRHSTYPPPQHGSGVEQRGTRRMATADRAGMRERREGLPGLFSEERTTDRAASPSSSSSSESSSTTDNEREALHHRPDVDGDEDAIPEAARDLHQARTDSLPRSTSRRRETHAGQESRLSHFFRRHHDEHDATPPEDSGHTSHSLFRHAPDFSFPLRTLPRVRRRSTTRYRGTLGGESDGSERDIAEHGTAGFMHSVWGTGRQQSEGE